MNLIAIPFALNPCFFSSDFQGASQPLACIILKSATGQNTHQMVVHHNSLSYMPNLCGLRLNLLERRTKPDLDLIWCYTVCFDFKGMTISSSSMSVDYT